VQLSTDALSAYTDAVERAFGAEVDYGSIVKTFGQAELEEQRRYSRRRLQASDVFRCKGNRTLI